MVNPIHVGQASKISGVYGKLKRLVLKNRPQKKLVSSRHDVRLVRRARGNKLPKWGQISNLNRILSPLERQLIRGSIVAILIAIVWLGSSYALKNRTVVPAVGGKYIEAVVGAPQSVNPLFASVNGVDRDITRLVFSGLMRYNEKQELVPDLAESFEISDDKKTYTFNLRENVVWHDGEPFTANDVVFTIKTIQDPQVGSSLQLSFQGVKISAPDEHTVVFGLNEPFSPFLSALTVGIIPDHIWFDISTENMRLVRYNLQPIGTGPFMFKGFKKEESGRIHSYELVRNQNFYLEPPYIKEFVFQFYNMYDGPDGAIQALREQKVDGLQFVPTDLQEKVKRKHIVLHTLELPQYTALFINQDKVGTLQDKDLREALSYTIDKDRILLEAIEGEGQVIHSPILLGFPGYSDNVSTTEYNITKAQDLLEKKWKKITAEEYRLLREEQLRKEWEATIEQTGENDTSTSTEATSSTAAFVDEEIARHLESEINEAQIFYRKNDDGEILSLSIVTADTPEYRQAAQLIAGSWQEAGIKTEVKFVPPHDMAREVLKEGNYDILLYGVLVGSDPDQYPFWHSSQVKFPGLNLSHYVNRNVDEILKKARETIDESEVEKLYSEFQTIILNDIPAIFLYQPTYMYATTDKVEGIDAEKIAHPSDRFSDVTGWYLKTKSIWLGNNK